MGARTAKVNVVEVDGSAQCAVAYIAALGTDCFFIPGTADAFNGFGARGATGTGCQLIIDGSIDADIGAAASFSLGPCAIAT